MLAKRRVDTELCQPRKMEQSFLPLKCYVVDNTQNSSSVFDLEKHHSVPIPRAGKGVCGFTGNSSGRVKALCVCHRWHDTFPVCEPPRHWGCGFEMPGQEGEGRGPETQKPRFSFEPSHLPVLWLGEVP